MSGTPGERPRGRYRHGVVRWVAAGLIVVALVAAVLPGFGGGGSDDGEADGPIPASSATATSVPATVSSTASTVEPAPTTDGSPASTAVDVPSLFDLITDDPQFSWVENAIEAAGLFDDLENGGPFTLFVPSNDAFEGLDPAFAGAINADPELLQDVLFHHALDGTYESDELRDGPIETVGGSTVVVDTGAAGIRLESGVTDAVVTDADLVAANGVLHVIDGILVPPELAAVVEAEVEADASVIVSVAGGAVVLAGAVGDDTQRTRLLAAVEESVDPRNVDDRLVLDPAVAADEARLDDLASISGLLPIELVEGEARLAGEAIAVSGVDVDDAARRRLETRAAELDTDVLFDLERRPVADAGLAAAIADDVRRFLAEQPLRFEAGVTFADPGAGATLDRLAALVKSAAGLDVVIVGFTDTSGDEASNLRTSVARAEEVRRQLVRRGVPAAGLVVAGFGETSPVLVDGLEDPAASRRVEIAVRPTETTP